MGRRRSMAALIFAATLAAALVVPGQARAAAAQAAPGPAASHRLTRPAVVSLGDSYIAGEAGRWKGNSPDPAPGHAGTDRAHVEGTADDPSRIYGPTAGGCDRSDVAPVISARLPLLRPINLACSGATTQNVLRASSGGVSYQGELPQDDQLAAVATKYRVALIYLSIGGNDLGFGAILQSCLSAFLTGGTPCSTTQQPVIDARLPLIQARVEAVITDIRATMTDAGYRPYEYRLILQSYPTPIPAGADFRYTGAERASVGGCPFTDVDADWTGDTLVPALTAAQKAAANTRHIQFLDLGDAVAGHQLCSKEAVQSTGTPDAATNEWIRFIDLAGQGSIFESLHPNYFGQHVIGRCMAEAILTLRNVSCHATPGKYLNGVWLSA